MKTNERKLPCGGYFFQQADSPLVGVIVLLHGFLGNAEHMRKLAEFFYSHGYSVVCPNLPGHGTKPEDLVGIRFWDILQSLALTIGALYQREIERVNGNNPTFYLRQCPLVLCGYSLGGTTAIRLASCFPGCQTKLITINAPMDWIRVSERFVPIVSIFKPWLTKPPSPGDYSRFPTSSVGLLHEAVCEARRNAHEVMSPTLIVHAEDDPLVSVSHAEIVRDYLKHVHPKMEIRPIGKHALPTGNMFAKFLLKFITGSPQ